MEKVKQYIEKKDPQTHYLKI